MTAACLLLAGLLFLGGTQPRTMRLDYFHTGVAGEESFSLDGLVFESPWPGPPNRMTDDTDLGRYQFQILDRRTNGLLYSRGFASIYGEWETTAEARETRRTFHESLRFPQPPGSFQVVLKKRDRRNAFREIWSIVVDPALQTVDRALPSRAGQVWSVMKNGEPQDKVDLLLMGDGYTAAEMEKWHRDARRTTDILFAASPFKERRHDFNVWAVDTPAE
jgi:hypothetical protein